MTALLAAAAILALISLLSWWLLQRLTLTPYMQWVFALIFAVIAVAILVGIVLRGTGRVAY